LNAKRIVRIPDPRVGLTVDQIEHAAERFVTANPFDETVGALVSLAGAEIVKTNRMVLI